MILKPYYETELGKLYHGDCLEIMPHLEPVDLVLTDPPYGINMAEWDKTIPTDKVFRLLIKKSQNQIIWGGNYFNLPHNEGWICWDKTFSDDIRQKKLTKGGVPRENMSDFELIWTSFLKKSKFIRYTYIGNLKGFNDNLSVDYKQPKKEHPTQKPIDLILCIMELCPKHNSILDAFLGSGTTAVACERLGCRWIGIEIEEKYCAISAKRIENERKQLRLF